MPKFRLHKAGSKQKEHTVTLIPTFEKWCRTKEVKKWKNMHKHQFNHGLSPTKI